jgi:type III pantothenate kinase
MLLACDIGNTNIKAGIFTDDRMSEFHFLKGITPLIEFIKKNKFTDLAISSVVPSKTKNLTDKLYNLNFTPVIINNNSLFNLSIDYDSKETLGIDRICSAEGAYYLYCRKKELKKDQIIISIDLGTATTLNVVRFPKIFAGGIIAPGTELMFRSLKNDTAQLPIVSSEAYKNIIGKTTNESIASGVMHSASGLIEKTINLIKTETKAQEVFIYITGGNFENIKRFLNFDYVYERGLVLYGINAIYKKSKGITSHS